LLFISFFGSISPTTYDQLPPDTITSLILFCRPGNQSKTTAGIDTSGTNQESQLSAVFTPFGLFAKDAQREKTPIASQERYAIMVLL